MTNYEALIRYLVEHIDGEPSDRLAIYREASSMCWRYKMLTEKEEDYDFWDALEEIFDGLCLEILE